MTFSEDVRLAQQAAATGDQFRFGTVTSVSPLKVRLDGDLTAETPITKTFQPVLVGDQVWVQQHGRQYLLLGRINAPRAPGSLTRIGATERTTDTAAAPGSATAFNILTFTIPTAYCVNGTRYRITYSGHVNGNTLNSYCDVLLKIGVNANTGGAQIDGCFVTEVGVAGRTVPFSKTIEYVYGTNSEVDGASPQNLVVVGAPSSGSYYASANAARKTGIYVDLVST